MGFLSQDVAIVGEISESEYFFWIVIALLHVPCKRTHGEVDVAMKVSGCGRIHRGSWGVSWMSECRFGGAARKLDQYAARKLIQLKDVHQTPSSPC